MNADALAVPERPGAAARFERFWTWLLSELAPFPGRGAATLRMTIACLVIVTISMALEVPQAYLSAFFVFFMSREDVVTTTITGIALALALAVGFGLTIFAYLITVDHPPLRLALMALIFCAAMYLSRIFVLGPIFFGIGIIVLISQQFVDLYPGPELLVRSTLWSLVVILSSGVLLFLSEAMKCYASKPFQVKMMFLFAALIFHFTIHRKVTKTDRDPGLFSGLFVGVVSLFLWLGVGLGGRAIGFL